MVMNRSGIVADLMLYDNLNISLLAMRFTYISDHLRNTGRIITSEYIGENPNITYIDNGINPNCTFIISSQISPHINLRDNVLNLPGKSSFWDISLMISYIVNKDNVFTDLGFSNSNLYIKIINTVNFYNNSLSNSRLKTDYFFIENNWTIMERNILLNYCEYMFFVNNIQDYYFEEITMPLVNLINYR